MFLIKFGGSVITDKTQPCVFKADVVDRLASEVQRAHKDVILIHGAGSFGHILAKQYRLHDGYKQKRQLKGAALTQAQVQQLNTLVLHALHAHHLPAVSLPAHVILSLRNHKPLRVDYSLFTRYLDMKFLPVSFGDVVLDTTLGFSICSGDLLMQLLAVKFKPEKVIFVLDEDGLYSANPKTDRSATFIQDTTVGELKQFTTRSNTHADVTKGMEGKLRTIAPIAKAGIDTILLNGNLHNRLYDTLQGKKVRQTVIHGEKV
ncbi:MAG: isopentenyl phosphate kinase family protein [Candidatus Thermoplasmatota archaeon]|nr:isopentenyl phosphate kinase family protein [Candidatus Thermoplasmatota archaeon]